MNEFDAEMCFMVSLYGSKLREADLVPVLGDAVELLRKAGQPPTHLSVSARGFGAAPLQFGKAWKRLQKAATEDLESVGILSFIEDWKRLADWTATCLVIPEFTYFHLGASLCAMPDAELQILTFVRNSITRIRPAYGTGFFRTRGQGPGLYGIGLAYGRRTSFSGPVYEDDLATCRWTDGMNNAVYDDGFLRDVYAHNLLTARHLERDIDGRSLEAWIRAEPSRGQLATWENGYCLWTVNREHRAAIRSQLFPSGILFVRRPETPL